MIKYIGSKRTLAPAIVSVVRSLSSTGTVLDVFSGSARIGYALKRAGYRVIANDHNQFAHTLAQCYVQADREQVEHQAERLIREFNALPGSPGYFTETFCLKSRYFQPHNGERVDAIREAIDLKGVDPDLKSVLLVSLMEAADRVDSTTGVQMAYLKNWSVRSNKRLELRMPSVLAQAASGRGLATCFEADVVAKQFESDVAYLDPPYNQHSYLGNYHIWESLVRWDKPQVYGTACKREDCKLRRSPFNSRKEIHRALARVIGALRCRAMIISFSDEGFISRSEMEAMLAMRGCVHVVEHVHRRYIGAQIGIYNPFGHKVGRAGHRQNTEYLYIVSADDALIRDTLSNASTRPVACV